MCCFLNVKTHTALPVFFYRFICESILAKLNFIFKIYHKRKKAEGLVLQIERGKNEIRIKFREFRFVRIRDYRIFDKC